MTIIADKKIIILIPFFEDVESFYLLLKSLVNIYSDVKIILVDDGSIRNSVNISIFDEINIWAEIIYLKRNVGHQRAIAIGLNYIASIYPDFNVLVMDSDGEDDPGTIDDLITQFYSDSYCIVAVRTRRYAGLIFDIFYYFYKLTFKTLSGRSINFGNFVLLSSFAVSRLVAMQELWLHLPATILLSRLPIKSMPIARARRYIGNSKMSFVNLITHGLRALIVFSDDVLVRVGISCAVLAGLSLLFMPTPFLLKLIGLATPGWASLLFGLFILIFIQAGAIALIALLLSGNSKGSGLSHEDIQPAIARIVKSKCHSFLKE